MACMYCMHKKECNSETFSSTKVAACTVGAIPGSSNAIKSVESSQQLVSRVVNLVPFIYFFPPGPQELKNADIALRTQKIPPGLQHENTAPAE